MSYPRLRIPPLVILFLLFAFFLPGIFGKNDDSPQIVAQVPYEPSSNQTQAEQSSRDIPPAPNHSGQAALVLISLVVILMGAKLGGDLFERLRQPAVLGELLFGVVLGNLSIVGFHGLDYLKTNEVIGTLAELGVIFLLFEVGLESN